MEKIKNKKLIAIIFVIIIVVVILVIINVTKGKSGYSVSRNQTLNINENNDNLSIKVESVEGNIYLGGMFESEKKEYTRVKLSITNNTNKEISILTYNFTLIDSKDNELDSVSAGLQSFNVENSVEQSELLASKIPAGQNIDGYVYFETDSKDIKKLRIACPTKNKTQNKSIVAGYEVYFEYYYINL